MRTMKMLALGLLAAWSAGPALAVERVVCTTFPMYQITRQITEGREGVQVDLLLPASLGCPHHHALSPQDMQKLVGAEVLVVNGLGMEEFLGAPVQRANPRLVIVDSSRGVTGLLAYAEHGHNHEAEHHHEAGHEAEHEHPEDHDDHDDHGEAHHHHGGLNPHLFASPRMAAELGLNIAAGLSAADPEGAAVYYRNATRHAQVMNKLADEMAALVGTLKNRRIVQPHGVFDYLARDIGLEVVAVTQPHGIEPSAAELLELVETIRAKQAGAIFTEPQYSPRVGEMLARETGLPVAQLDPAASGPDAAPMDYVMQVMRRNMDVLRDALGGQ